jgi:hypothetical protein
LKGIKLRAVVVAMALALAALLGAQSASAAGSEFKSAIEPTTWTGTTTNSHELTLPSAAATGFHSCENGFSGTTQSKSTTEVTVVHKNAEGKSLLRCVDQLGNPVTWSMGSCEYKLHPGNSSLVGSLDLTNCGSSPMTFTSGSCTITIGNQNGLGSVTYKYIETGGYKEITATASLTSITYTNTAACGTAGTHSDGSYTGAWTIKGTSGVGGPQASIWVESGESPPPTFFAGEEAPVTIAGANNVTQKRLSAGGTLSCTNYSLSGASSTVTSGALTLAPTFTSCTWSGVAIPDSFVTTGGCSFVLHVNREFDITGAKCASEPIMLTRPGCIVTIGPQSGLMMSSLSPYTNEGSGRLRSVSVSAGSIEGLTYTLYGPKCGGEGTFSNGNVRSVAVLSATNSAKAAQGISVE